MSLSYQSPLASRYASRFMQGLFSEKERAVTFRHLWILLAQIQKKLGLEISEDAIEDMIKHLYEIDLDAIKDIEQKTHHDVMAHIEAFGLQAVKAKKIIHLGATSCYVTDNADVLIYKKALHYLLPLLKNLIKQLIELAQKNKNLVCVSYTHFQVAQPTTMGKRICLWIQDLFHLHQKLDQFSRNMKMLGIKGATGGQSSFYDLFDGDLHKLELMERYLEQMVDCASFSIASQTYTRLQDSELMHILSEIGATFHKIGNDLRLLSHTQELSEGFSKEQVGSSAMPHKKNPMHSERLCSLSRFLMQLAVGTLETQANQWLERSLDDSAIRRLNIPQAFLALDALIHLAEKIFQGIQINQDICSKILETSLVELSQEPLLMHLVRLGHDRQKTHAKLKKAVHQYEGDLQGYIRFLKEKEDLDISENFLGQIISLESFRQPCSWQVDSFLSQIVLPNL